MKIRNLLFLSLALTIGLFSCSEDESIPKPKSNIVFIDADILTPTTWYSDSLYVITTSINIYAELTIPAGTIIKFYKDVDIELFDNGKITAIGTETLPIIFTSIKDDIGGDTNGDLLTSKPEAGDWDLIDLKHQSGSQFIYCVFSYGGDDSYSGVLELGSNDSKVDHCLFYNNTSYINGNVYYGSLAAQEASIETVITNNTFYSNRVPLSIHGHLSIDNTNSFSKAGDVLLTNTFNGIFVHGQDIIDYNVTWQESEVAYVIQYDGFEIWDNYSLTLGDNVVLKFNAGAMLDIQLKAELVNYDGEGVYFTSYMDDTHKGDTNGDGALTAPTSTEWLGIYNNQETNYFYTWSNILFSKNDF